MSRRSSRMDWKSGCWPATGTTGTWMDMECRPWAPARSSYSSNWMSSTSWSSCRWTDSGWRRSEPITAGCHTALPELCYSVRCCCSPVPGLLLDTLQWKSGRWWLPWGRGRVEEEGARHPALEFRIEEQLPSCPCTPAG